MAIQASPAQRLDRASGGEGEDVVLQPLVQILVVVGRPGEAAGLQVGPGQHLELVRAGRGLGRPRHGPGVDVPGHQGARSARRSRASLIGTSG